MEESLWQARGGRVLLDHLQPYCVIDRCAASVGDLTFRVGSGGTRIYGKRPLTPERSTIEAQQGFFTSLKASLQEKGQLLPILIWGINGKLYTRYGASRVWAARQLGWKQLDAVLCAFDKHFLYEGFIPERDLMTPVEILEEGFGYPMVVGYFECSHERLDAHRMEPYD
jgi:hypothetical protein